MPFVLPNFNLPVNIWQFGANPATTPPDRTAMGNLCFGRRIGVLGPDAASAGTWLLLPPGTDIRDDSVINGPDTVEAGAGSKRYYTVMYVDDIGGGFPNEHRFAFLNKRGTWPTPIPRPGSVVTLPPGPWVHRYNNSTGGVPANIISSPYSSGLTFDQFGVLLMVVNNAAVPTLSFNGTTVPMSLVNSITTAGITARLWFAAATVGGTPTPIYATLAGGTNALMVMIISTCANCTGGTDTQVNNTGAASLPNQFITTVASGVEALLCGTVMINTFPANFSSSGSLQPIGTGFFETLPGFYIMAQAFQFVTPSLGTYGLIATPPPASVLSWGTWMNGFF